jgi:hypothetical protein
MSRIEPQSAYPAYVVCRHWDYRIEGYITTSPYWELEEEVWFSSLVEAVVYFKKATKSAHKNHRFVMWYACDDFWADIMYKV